MTTDDFRKLYHAQPFSPFQIVLKGGRVVTVLKAEHMTINPANSFISVGNTIKDFEFIHVREIEGVRLLGPVLTSLPDATPAAT